MTHDQDMAWQLRQRFRNWGRSKKVGFLYDDQERPVMLELRDLGLKQIPWEVWQIFSLQKLDLSGNKISTLPPEIGQLTSLQWLNLSGNRISALPPEIRQLTSLQELSLTFNRLTTLPREIGQLTALRQLHLSGNKISTLPSEIGQLTSLQMLILDDNQLDTLPPEIRQLTSLQWLDLTNNRLTTLPKEIGQLTALQDLSLSFNRLTTLPKEIGQLTALHRYSLFDNPWQIPPEIMAQDIFAISAYLQALQRTGVKRSEAKVILVGGGGTGKTSLVRALQGKDFVEGLPATHGIETVPLSASHPTRPHQQITLYTWDFGGQEIYQATHQLFLTRRSVYLLVWNARYGAEAGLLSFWLNTITAHAPDAKILLVATHCDLWPMPDIDLAVYQRRYPQVVTLCAISNRSGEGLDMLKIRIVETAVQTPFVDQHWPHSWVNAEQALLTRPEHHIDIGTFLATCIQHNIEDEKEREIFGRTLHDLGKILYFHDDPILKTLIILKPNRISKVISLVLLDPQVRRANGILEHRDLARIWATDEQGRAYPRSLYPMFLRLMEHFALCYHLEPERPGQPVTQSLIPQLLPHQPPASLSSVPTQVGTSQVVTQMCYALSFVPAGLMSWFLVRSHRYSQLQHWREGARLAYAGQQAQITLDQEQREITITVWGPFPYTFLLILKQTLDDLLSTFQGLRVQRQIPCRCEEQQHLPHFLVYEDLEAQQTQGHTEIVCPKGRQVSLATLLYGIHASTLPQMEHTVRQTQQLVMQQREPAPNAQPDKALAEEMRRLRIRLEQGQELLYRTLIQQQRQHMNLERQKVNAVCPNLFLLERAARRPLNPHDWVSRAYRLRLLCQYPQGPHPITGEQGYEVRQGQEWWNVMSPWLRRMVKVLEVGLPLGKAVNEVFKLVDIERFAPAIDVFNEILADLPEIEVIDGLSNAQLDGNAQMMQRLEGAALRALAHFLDTVDPAQHWQGLSQVIADEGAIWWVCEQHRQELEGH